MPFKDKTTREYVNRAIYVSVTPNVKLKSSGLRGPYSYVYLWLGLFVFGRSYIYSVLLSCRKLPENK